MRSFRGIILRNGALAGRRATYHGQARNLYESQWRSRAAIANFYKIAAAEILVVLDDLALPLGRLRLRAQGSSGGHNGLESVFEHFGTEAVPRLRVGIGAAPSRGAVDYVLGRFFDEEKPVLDEAIERAAEAAKCAVDKGLFAAMNVFNKPSEL
jgi:PTH1 family peptidyl-tRNA hydrolase